MMCRRIMIDRVMLDHKYADLVVENARIWSEGLDEKADFAAIKDGRFIFVGGRDDQYIGTHTKRIDAEGRTVLPGMIDCHLHMLWGGVNLNSGVDLRPARSRAQFITIIENHITEKRLSSGQWITGGRWFTDGWNEPENPTRWWIDDVTGNHPALLYRMDGHSALVNSKALSIAGIDSNTPDPESGVIERDVVSGEPTGILRESAIHLVSQHRPEPTLEQQLAGCRSAAKLALANGITAVGDIVEFDTLAAYEKLAVSDPATNPEAMVRFFMYVSDQSWDQIIEAVEAFQSRPTWVQIAGLKDYMDGSLGSRTAAMHEAYVDNDGANTQPNFGLFMENIREGRLERNLCIARDHGLQPIYHAIGDEATHVFLDTLNKVMNQETRKLLRPRVEHAQHLLTEDVTRFATLDVIASMQPYHKFDDAQNMANYLGDKRCGNSYMFRSLLQNNANIAFGSDWPIVTMNPWEAIETAVNNTTVRGNDWHANESITLEQALCCYTTRAAYALHAENEIGRIAPGYHGDFIILSESPFNDNMKSYNNIHPVITVVEGRIVYEK